MARAPPFDTLTANLQDIFSSAYSVSAFTNWQSREVAQVGRRSLALHFTWHSREEKVLAPLPAIEAALDTFAARSHSAKLFTIGSDRLDALYPKLAAFGELRASFDPDGTFRNQFLGGLGI